MPAKRTNRSGGGPPPPPHPTDNGVEDSQERPEEEPEDGEDLFGDNYLNDYGSESDDESGDGGSGDEIPTEGDVDRRRGRDGDRDFIVDDDDSDEGSEGGDSDGGGGGFSFADRLAVDRAIDERNRREQRAFEERRRARRLARRQGGGGGVSDSASSDDEAFAAHERIKRRGGGGARGSGGGGGYFDDDDGEDDDGFSYDEYDDEEDERLAAEGRTPALSRSARKAQKRSRGGDDGDDGEFGSRSPRGRNNRHDGGDDGDGGGGYGDDNDNNNSTTSDAAAGHRSAADHLSTASELGLVGGVAGASAAAGLHGPVAELFAVDDQIYLNESLASEAPFDWTRPQGSVADWLSQEIPRRVAKNRIFYFFSTYTRNPEETPRRYVFREALQTMTQNNGKSLEVSYWDLGAVYNSTLALWLADVPETLVELLEEAANYLVFRVLYPHYYKVHKRIHVRLIHLPVCDPIRDFRQVHTNVIVRVEGVVIRRSPVYPQLQAVKYDCGRCSYIIGPIMHRGDRETKVSQCPSCHSKGPFRVNMALTEYRNHQTIVLQEPPGKVPPGRLPRSVEVVLTHDLIDRAKPGEEVEVTGVYKNTFDPVLNSKQGFPVFTTILHANNICRRSGAVAGGEGSARGLGGASARLSDADRELIIQLSRHPNIKRKLLQSVAPSIHGREDIKLGLLLSLLGGVPKDIGGDKSHRIRGDINVLLVGDPGCAKSQFLKYVEITADRAVFTTGRGSTAVGLTASVQKDAVTGDFTLEGGALVIADKGVCLIDEFDKMSDQDRTSIHEAMEQQTISVAKGGIVATLSARCSIIAAANPIGGRYDPSLPFDSNVNLTTPILSRFDLLFVVRDEINPENDEKLASFICNSHYKNHPHSRAEAAALKQDRDARMADLRHDYQSTDDEAAKEAIAHQIEAMRQEERERSARENTVVEDLDCNSPNPLPQQVLKQFIYYARNYCLPRVIHIDENIVTRVYTELRQESKQGGLPITVRHMESLIRLTEAHARIHLRDYARDEDAQAAIAFFLRCFLQTQKYSARTALNNKFRRYLDSDKEPLQLLHFKLRALVTTTRQFEWQLQGASPDDAGPVVVSVDCSELDAIAAAIGLSTDAVQNYYKSDTFNQEFTLVLDRRGDPSKIEHKLIA